MQHWRGRELIESIQAPVIAFEDIADLQKLLIDGVNEEGQRQMVVCTEFGRVLHQIANDESLEVEEQVQKMAEEMVRLLAKACLGTDDVEKYYAARHPLPPTASSIGGLYNSTEYPIAVVARVKVWEEEEGRWHSWAKAVRLNRIAAWVAGGDPARGDPDKARPLALHRCGSKSCLALPCLRWGDHIQNARDGYEEAYRREKADPDFKPKM